MTNRDISSVSPSRTSQESNGAVGRAISLRTYLLGFVGALLTPALVFAGLLLWLFHDSGVKQYERDALELSRRISDVVDRDIVSVRRSLQVLATSRLIAEQRFADLYNQAVEIKEIVGSEIIVKDASGQQLVNTRLPWGTPLPVSLPEADRKAMADKVPTVSDVFIGATAQRPIVSINVPVLRDGKAIGLINTGIDPLHLSRILRDHSAAATWTIAIVDKNGKIVARSREPGRFINTLATEDLRANAVSDHGTWVGWTADRIPVVAGYTRSSDTGWVTAVGVPKSIVEAPLWRSLIALGVGALIALGVAFLAAHLLSRPLTRWTETLSVAAGALGRGESFVPPPVRIAELRNLSNILSVASRDLNVLKSELESQVAERTRELSATNDKLVAEVTQREKIEDQLRHSQKMEAIGQLTGGLAHDFNNLLTIIGGSLQLLRRRWERGETGAFQQYLESATDGVAKASALTHRLLAFGRQQPLLPKVIDANELVKGMSDLLRRSIGETVTVETVSSGGLWRTHADSNQLENAVLNLVLNARDAMPEGGKLTIETANVDLDERYAVENPGAPTGQFVMIAVTDTGGGMTQDVIGRAFDPFFTTKSPGQGTGLGLSQVYGFVRQSGGHIKIYSEAGVGTSVKLYLPRFFGEAGPDLAVRSTPAIAGVAGGPHTILVVEDDAAVRRLSVDFLSELGYIPIAADGAAAALRILDSRSDIDLLFTDVVMPDMNGRRLADEALKKYPKLKVLFATGYTKNAVVHGGIIDPDVLLLAKPFTIEQLAVKVAQALKA